MRAQMSLEVLVYVFLAGISIVYSLSLVSGYYSRESAQASSYEYSNFAEAINIALMNGASAVDLYIPPGLCNSTQTSDSMETSHGKLYFAEPVRISYALLCSPGNARANITQDAGYFVVG